MTHAILEGLHQDHINMSKIAALIAAELADLEDGAPLNYDLLENIMSYVTAYPDTYHHPTEDIVFARLRHVAPEAGTDIDALLAEHEKLLAYGREFLRAIRAIEEDAVVTRAEFLEKGRGYLELLSGHMNREEAGLFRLAAEHLDVADWEEIGARVEAMEDPLFGSAVNADYRRLWQRITAHQRIR
jgi:hemerythrin-like domain-containing protein